MATAQLKLVLGWSEQFSVGVEQFDREHEKLFFLVGSLYDSIRTGANRTAVGALLGDLYAYSVGHMTHEEDILEEYGFPDLAAHRTEHKHFRKQLRDYMDEFDAGRTAIAVSLLQFLQDWLKMHMQGTDRQYVNFLHSKSVH